MTLGTRDPEISLIVPYRNVAAHFAGLLDSLRTQVGDLALEVILVDNQSRDGSRAIAERYAEQLPTVLLSAPELANASYARNVGARAARGTKLLFADADDVLAPGYVSALSAALDQHEYVTSRVDSVTLNPPWLREVHGPHWQDTGVTRFYDFLMATGVNIGIRRDLYLRIGGFPEHFAASQDIEFSWRAQLAGAQIAFVPEAVYQYRFRESLSGLFHQSRHWGRSNVQLYTEFRAAGMRRRPAARIIRDWLAPVWELRRCWRREARGRVAVRLGACIGRVQGSVHHRVVYL